MPQHDQVTPYKRDSEVAPKAGTVRDIVRNALRTLSKILRNSLLNATVSWLLAFLVSKGIFASGLNAEQQSYAEFVAVKTTWFYVFFWVFTLTQSAFRLLPETFVSKLYESTLSVFQVYSKLVQSMLPYAVMVTFLSIAGGVGIACLPPASRKFKADLHWTLFCCSFVMALAGTYTNHIFRFETVRGRTQSIIRLHQAELEKDMAAIARLSSLSSPRPPSHSQFLRSFFRNMPFVASALLAAAYVHIVDYIPITTQWVFVVFALCSLVLKILIQELAKRYLRKMATTPSMRSMAVIVAAPTILVDTQLRTALLCHSNVSSTLVSSVALAVVEISLRTVKTRHVRHQLQRAYSRRPHSIIAVVPQHLPGQKSNVEPHQADLVMKTLTMTPTHEPASSSDFPEQKLLSLRTAEVYADMCAEYIAMGSSYTILYFFGSNPKFHLGNDDTAAFINDGYLATIVLQLGIEVVVDFVATSLEISMGVDFEIFNRDDTFLALFMVGIATLNVHISSGVYLKE